VAEADAGSSLTCACGRKVIVPLLEEFRDRPLLLSAATLERRVQRLIAEGELPPQGACLRCESEREAGVVNVALECEKYKTRTYGGTRFLILPWLWVAWREEERVEIRGRHTDVPAPVCLCEECRSQFRRPPGSGYLLLATLLVAVSGIVGYFNLAAGVGLATVGLVLLGWHRHRVLKKRQRALKGLLQKVPVYRQVLARYPRAVVVMPDGGPPAYTFGVHWRSPGSWE
jgi:hypothetical protein